MYTGMIIADTFLFLGFNEKVPITPMKLQKLVYCAYKEHLKKHAEQLFEEKFLKWKYGPVLHTVYDSYSNYRGNPITSYYKSPATIINMQNDSDAKKSIALVWNKYKTYSAVRLSTLTHGIGTAWEKANFYLEDEDIKNEEDYK